MISELELSEFLQILSPIYLHHSEPKSNKNPWVFWSESDGCENNSSSLDLGITPMIHEMIKSALSNTTPYWWLFFAQFWAPVTIDSRRLLSTSHQPFALNLLCNDFAQYRLHSEKYKYNIDMNKVDIEPEHMILSGGPATAFLNCRASIDKPQGFLLELNDKFISVMVPICFPFKSNCLGVLDFTYPKPDSVDFFFHTFEAIKKAGLDVFYVQHLIPYKTINCLEVTKDEIEEALKVVCQSHDLTLAQVWIPYEDTNNVPFSYSLEDTQTKRLLAIKLTGYLYAVAEYGYKDFEPYFRFGDVMPHAIGEEFPLVTLQDYESRYMSKLHSDMHINWDDDWCSSSALAICMRSDNTGDLIYVLEFIWTRQSNYVILLEDILLTLKRCLPRFKFASGAELGDELDVILVDSSTDDETQKLKIFQEKRSSQMPTAPEKGKSQMVVDLIAPSKVTCKTAPKVLPREVIEKHFGKTMKEAAKDLNVSLSTLKRKCKEHRILEWRGPKVMKRNANDSSTIQSNTNEEDNGAIEGISTLHLNKDVLILKAEYADDIIKLHLPISQATFVAVQKEISMKLKLSVGSFKVKYIDEDKQWISLTSDEDVTDCINCSKKADQNGVHLHVLRMLPSPEPLFGPDGFFNY